jgi:hypothetical protein
VTLSASWLIAVGVVIAGLIAWGTVDTLRLEAAQAQLANLATEVGAAKGANDSNLFTIHAQATSLAAWSEAAAAQVTATQAAVASLAATEAARVKTTATLNALQARDRALPACTALMAVDLSKVCPGTAQAVLERSK